MKNLFFLSGSTGNKIIFSPFFLLLWFIAAGCETSEVAPAPTNSAVNTDASMGAEAGWTTVTLPAQHFFGISQLASDACLGEDVLISGTFTYRLKVSPTQQGDYLVIAQLSEKQTGLSITGAESGMAYDFRSAGFLQGRFVSLETQQPISVRHQEKATITNPATGATIVLSHSLRLLPNSQGEIKVFLDELDLNCQPRQSKNK